MYDITDDPHLQLDEKGVCVLSCVMGKDSDDMAWMDSRAASQGWRPSLHKMSMMGHCMRLMPYLISILECCGKYPSEETCVELLQITWVPLQTNKSVMGIIQDILCGICKFTLQDTFLNWIQV
ncbi:hypothetical protein J3A83DRAFT_4197563 [Scleroderma citrinum]